MKLEEILGEIRKGRRFRMKRWEDQSYIEIGAYNAFTFTVKDLLADDFELEPIKREISRDDLAKAWYKASGQIGATESQFNRLFKLLCQELSL